MMLNICPWVYLPSVRGFFWKGLICLCVFWPFSNWIFLLLSFVSHLYILDTSPLWNMWLANILFHPVACLVILLLKYIYLILVKFNLSVFLLWIILPLLSLNTLPSLRFLKIFSPKCANLWIKRKEEYFSYFLSIIVFHFIFKPMINFELIFV